MRVGGSAPLPYNIGIAILCAWTVFVNSFIKGIDEFLFFYYTVYAGNRAGAK